MNTRNNTKTKVPSEGKMDFCDIVFLVLLGAVAGAVAIGILCDKAQFHPPPTAASSSMDCPDMGEVIQGLTNHLQAIHREEMDASRRETRIQMMSAMVGIGIAVFLMYFVGKKEEMERQKVLRALHSPEELLLSDRFGTEDWDGIRLVIQAIPDKQKREALFEEEFNRLIVELKPKEKEKERLSFLARYCGSNPVAVEVKA